jgi:trehalose utilization protein
MKIIIVLLSLLFSSAALAGATYALPDPSIIVTPNWSNTTTIVTVGSTTYRGASAFYYVRECAKPDSSTYHCMIIREDHTKLTSDSGAAAFVTLTVQSASTLIRSGHNYWRQTDTVLSGSLTFP